MSVEINVKVKIGKKEVVFSHDEAKEIYNALKEVFRDNKPYFELPKQFTDPSYPYSKPSIWYDGDGLNIKGTK